MQIEGRIPRLGFDCDGVLSNFTKSFARVCADRLGKVIPADANLWPQYNPIGPGLMFESKEEWNQAFEAVKDTELFWLFLEPLPGVNFADLDALMSAGVFNGYFVTRRCDQRAGQITDAQFQSRMWLENQGVKNYSAVVATQQPRLDVLKTYDIDAYIDDWADQVRSLRAAGINAFLISRGHNQDDHDLDAYRVSSVSEFVERAGVAWPASVLAETATAEAA